MNNGQIQLFYPDFVPNQVLTNTQLNDLRAYLEQQTRLSRVRLTGSGIVCGLTWSIGRPDGAGDDARALTVHGGYGVTSEGYLLELKERTFTRYYAYTDPRQDEDENPRYEPWHTSTDNPAQIDLLALAEEETEEITEDMEPLAAEALTGKVLVLYLEARDQELKSCLVTDCDNKGVKVQLAVRALLVDTDDLEALDPCEAPDAPVRVPRLHTALEDIDLADVDEAGQINRTYGRIVQQTWDGLAEQIEDAYDTYAVFLDLEDDALESISDAGEQLEDLPDDAFTQYHYDFIKDVATAYEEFLTAACHLIKPCFSVSTFPRHLMLGALDGDDGYRNEFTPSPVRNVTREDLQQARRLFKRLLALLRAFDVEAAEDIRITPSHTERYALGERAVPFYYGQPGEGLSDELAELWQPKDCCTTTPLLSYHRNGREASDYGYAAHTFFRIEGHLQWTCSEADDALATLKKRHNAEFDVRTVALQKASPEKELLQELDERLAEIDRTWQESPFWIRGITEVLREKDEIDWSEQGPAQVRAKVTELKKELFAGYEEWKTLRRQTERCCDLTALEADYREARSDLLSTYEPVFSYLDAVLDVLMQLPDLITERLPEMLGEEDASTARERVRSRLEELDREVDAVRSDLDAAEDAIERNALRKRLTALQRTKTNVRSLDETIRLSSVLSGSIRRAFETADGGEPAGEEVEREVPTFVLIVLYGLIQEIMRLRDTAHELVHYLLPQDLVSFNYTLFAREYRSVVRTTLEARLLPVFLVLYALALDFRDDIPDLPWDELDDFVEGAVDGSLGEGLLELLGGSEEDLAGFNPFTARLVTLALQVVGALPYVLTLLTGRYHNRTLSRLASISHAADAVHDEGCGTFGGLVRRQPGLEHLAGVEKGGTFVLVCDEDRQVVADFSLRGQVACCCELDARDVCLPPVAAPDYEVVVRRRPEGEADAGLATADIHVLRSDYGLNEEAGEAYEVDHEPGLRVVLPHDETEQGGAVEIAQREDGSPKQGWVTYTNSRRDFFGLDYFTYSLVDEQCEATTTGQVVVLVLPSFSFERRTETGTIVGTVRDKETNAPVTGAAITLEETGESTTTSSKGAFRIENLAPRTYTVVAKHSEYAPSRHVVTLSPGETEEVKIALSSEEEPIGKGNLALEVVDDDTGEPISIFDFKHSVENVDTGESPSEGLSGGNSITYFGLTPGGYRITVSKPGYISFATVVQVEADATRDVTVRLEPGPVIESEERGRLAFRVVEIGMEERPAPEVTLLVHGPAADELRCITDEDGRCETEALSAGEYIVSIPDRKVSQTVSVRGGETVEIFIRLVARTSFDIDRETPIVSWVAEMTGTGPEEARSGLVRLYNRRYARYVAGIEQTSDPVQRSDAYVQTAQFVGGVIPRSDAAAEELHDRYQRAAEVLGAAIREGDEAGYRRLLELATMAYLDRWTTLSPSEVSGEAENRFEALFGDLKQAGVDLSLFGERWNGSELVERLQIASAEGLLDIMRAAG